MKSLKTKTLLTDRQLHESQSQRINNGLTEPQTLTRQYTNNTTFE